jgi:hypothetical protein
MYSPTRYMVLCRGRTGRRFDQCRSGSTVFEIISLLQLQNRSKLFSVAENSRIDPIHPEERRPPAHLPVRRDLVQPRRTAPTGAPPCPAPARFGPAPTICPHRRASLSGPGAIWSTPEERRPPARLPVQLRRTAPARFASCFFLRRPRRDLLPASFFVGPVRGENVLLFLPGPVHRFLGSPIGLVRSDPSIPATVCRSNQSPPLLPSGCGDPEPDRRLHDGGRARCGDPRGAEGAV